MGLESMSITSGPSLTLISWSWSWKVDDFGLNKTQMLRSNACFGSSRPWTVSGTSQLTFSLVLFHRKTEVLCVWQTEVKKKADEAGAADAEWTPEHTGHKEQLTTAIGHFNKFHKSPKCFTSANSSFITKLFEFTYFGKMAAITFWSVMKHQWVYV